MKNSVLNLQVASLEELDRSLSLLGQGKIGKGNLGVLNLYGPQILVRQFILPALSPAEIKNALKLEAAEIFSLLPEEIEIDYQVLSSSGENIKGVFMGIPKELFSSYAQRLDKVKLAADKITANIFSRINCFLTTSKIKSKNFLIIDFFKDRIMNLAIFIDGQCELLREVQYSNFGDAEREVIYSLKYASSKSTQKKSADVYVLGDLSNKNDSIANLEKELGIVIKRYDLDAQLNVNLCDSFFNINLIKNYVFSSISRKKILAAGNIAVAVCLLLFLALGIKTIKQYKTIKAVRSSVSESDYKYALGLQQELHSLKNAK